MLPTSQVAANIDDVTAAVLAPQASFGTPTRDVVELLHERVLMLRRLRLWFESAARLLPAEVTGAHSVAENHRWLVRQLDAILAECTGRHIDYSKRILRFVELCFNAADSNVTFGSIKKAIEALIGSTPRH
jgi:hypothetical protein